MLMMGGTQKQTFSTFTGGSTRYDVSEDKKVTASVDVYISDFGTITGLLVMRVIGVFLAPLGSVLGFL